MSVAVSVMGVLPCVPSGDAHRGVSARGAARVTRHSRRGVPASRYVWACECHIWGGRGGTAGRPESCIRAPERADSRGRERAFAVSNVPTRAATSGRRAAPGGCARGRCGRAPRPGRGPRGGGGGGRGGGARGG